jgi:hypothetical protein
MKKRSWKKILNSISSLVVRKKAVPWKNWTFLLDVCNTSYKCHNALYWATKGGAHWKITTAFYNTLKIYTGKSFLHQRRLAEAAAGQEDRITLDQALEGMISQAKECDCLAWWEHIMKLMSQNDQRIAYTKWRIDKLRRTRRRNNQVLHRSRLHP